MILHPSLANTQYVVDLGELAVSNGSKFVLDNNRMRMDTVRTAYLWRIAFLRATIVINNISKIALTNNDIDATNFSTTTFIQLSILMSLANGVASVTGKSEILYSNNTHRLGNILSGSYLGLNILICPLVVTGSSRVVFARNTFTLSNVSASTFSEKALFVEPLTLTNASSFELVGNIVGLFGISCGTSSSN